MGDEERKWLEKFKAVNGFNNTSPVFSNIQRSLPITSTRPRKHRLSKLVDLTRVDMLLGRFRRNPRRV